MAGGAQESRRQPRQKPGLTPFDKKTIYNFKGFADIKLNNLKAAQGEFEKAIATRRCDSRRNRAA